MTFAVGGYAPNVGTSVATLHWTLMGGNVTLHNLGVGGNGVGGLETTAATPTASTDAGQQPFTSRVSTVWSALTAALNTFETEATTQEFLKKLLKWQADVGGESTKCAKFKTKAVEAANLWVFVDMVKWDLALKLFHSMVIYNDLFVAPNLSDNVIASMRDCPLEGRQWVLKIPRDKPWAWTEVKFLNAKHLD